MNKQIVAGIIFISIWIIIMLVWGTFNNSLADKRPDTLENPNDIPCSSGGSGHPLDNCW